MRAPVGARATPSLDDDPGLGGSGCASRRTIDVRGEPVNWDTVIGLEVHAQLSTRSKMFCGCPTAFGGAPNTQTCPVCQGMPGVLPVINRRAIELAIKTALAFNCRVNAACRFARKHYYYPDMPKNYQISQYEEPLAVDGWLDRKSTRLNSSHIQKSRMPSSA